MDIVEFFQLSSGKWFSHRTSHFLAAKSAEAGKSDVLIELLSKTEPAVMKLCEQQGIDPDLALCSTRITWSGTIEGSPQKQTGSTVLVLVADPANPNEGKVLRQVDHSSAPPVTGKYILGNDEALTLIVEEGTMIAEERIWFASPNFRLRTSVLKQTDGFSAASFCSEIRMGVTKPAEGS